MRIVVHLTKFYDWEILPSDVKVTQADIDAGKVMPARSGGYRMRVLKVPAGGTTRTCHITEADVIGKIIHEKTDVKRPGRTFNRKEAVAHFIQDHLLDESDWSWITKFEVHDDGPDESLFHQIVTPHTKAKHARRPGMNIDPESVDVLAAAYLEPTEAEAHVIHLSSHFGVIGAQ